MIIVTEDLFLGKGSHKKCYRHPLDSDKCIKFSYTEEGKKDLDREVRYQGILKRGDKDKVSCQGILER